MHRRRLREVILSVILLAVFGWLAHEAFYELFVYEPGVHHPRVAFRGTGTQEEFVRVTWNTPTTTALVVFAACAAGMVVSLSVFVKRIRTGQGRTKRHWLIMIACLAVTLLAIAIGWEHFLRTAFRGFH